MSHAPLPDLMHRHLTEVFGEKNSERRRKAIEELYSADCVCTDHKAELRGRAALNEKIDALYVRFPNFVFVAQAPADAHHDVARLHWRFGPPGETPRITGLDIGFVENGQIRRLYVFLDPMQS